MCLCYFRMDIRSVQLERGMRKTLKLTVHRSRGKSPDALHPSLSFDASSPSPIVDVSHTLGRRERSRVVSKKEYHSAETYVCMYTLNFLEVLRCVEPLLQLAAHFLADVGRWTWDDVVALVSRTGAPQVSPDHLRAFQ